MAQSSKNQTTTQTNTSLFCETQSEQFFDSSANCFEQFLSELIARMNRETAEFLQQIDQMIESMKTPTPKTNTTITPKGKNPLTIIGNSR